jgi:hypothetical protein
MSSVRFFFVFTMDFFFWFIGLLSIPLIAAIAIYSYYDRRDERDKVDRRIHRLEDYDMERDQQPRTTEVIKVRCSQCKTLNPEAAKFCTECGVSLQ